MSSQEHLTKKVDAKRVRTLSLLSNFDKLPDDMLVRVPVVSVLFSASEPTIWRWVKQGLIPAPTKVGPGISAWKVGGLRKTLAERR